MNRLQNLTALERLLEEINEISPAAQSMEKLLRAAYLHRIINALLTEQVDCLPETSKALH